MARFLPLRLRRNDEKRIKTVQSIPSGVNGKLDHLGGVSEAKWERMITLKAKKDEVFGEVVYEDLWTGNTDIIMFGKSWSIILSIYGEGDEEFTSNQKDAFLQFR